MTDKSDIPLYGWLEGMRKRPMHSTGDPPAPRRARVHARRRGAGLFFLLPGFSEYSQVRAGLEAAERSTRAARPRYTTEGEQLEGLDADIARGINAAFNTSAYR